MADRQFTYRVDIDTESAKRAADATRAMFAQSISGVGGVGGGTTQAKKIADFEIGESKRVANARINDIRRVWAVEAAEARKAMTAIQRQAAGVAGGGQQRGFDNNQLQGVLKTGFLAYGAYLATKQAAQGTVEFGRVGAQQLRMVETFKQLGDIVGVSADDMAQSVKKATSSAISDIQAMQFSATILAQRFAGEVDNIAGDTAILATASRRLAQIYPDQEGNLQSTEQVFNRFVKFAREGNKELVDQFGLSNDLIANMLDIPNTGLRGAEGAVDRWRGTIMFLSEELERLGQPIDSTADRMEQAFARMTTSIDNLRQASAEPITIAVEWTEQGVSNFARGLDRISAVKEGNALFEESKTSSNPALDAARASIIVLNNELLTGQVGLQEYAAKMRIIVDAFHEMEEAAKRAAAEMEAFRLNSERLVAQDFGIQPVSSEGANSLRMQRVLAGKIAPAELTEAERDYRMAVGGAAERVRILEAVVAAAVGDTEAWLKAQAALEGAQLDLAGVIDGVKGRFRALEGDIAQYRLDMRLGAAGSDAERLAILRDRGLSDTTPEGRANALKMQALENSIADDAAREWKRAAKEAETAWKAAAKEAERAFKDALGKIPGIPGVTGKTDVTQDQLDQAAAGIPQNFVDNFTRRMNDELINGIDYPEVSRGFVEELVIASSGIAPDVVRGLSNEMLAGRATEEISTGRVFGTPFGQENFSTLVDMEVAKQIEAQNLQAEAGGAFVTEKFRQAGIGLGGVSAAGAAAVGAGATPVDTGAAGAMEGLNTDLQTQIKDKVKAIQLAQTVGNGFSGAFNPGTEGYVNVATPTLANWNAQFGTEDTLKGLVNMGKSAAIKFFGGWGDGIKESPFGQQLIAMVTQSINKALADAAAGT